MSHEIENERILCKVSHSLIRRLDPEGLLVHGSRAKKRADSSSDIDLFLLSAGKHEGKFEYRHVVVEGVEADVSYCSFEIAQKLLKLRDPRNNNFLLNALVGGRVMFDREQKLAELCRLAMSIWSAGPPRIHPREENGIRRGLPMSLGSVVRVVERAANRGREAESLAMIACSNLFMKSVYGYCRLARVWTCGLPELVDRLIANPKIEIRSEIQDYLRSETLPQKVSALTRLVRAVSSANEDVCEASPLVPHRDSMLNSTAVS